MYQIDNATSFATLPAPTPAGTGGFFTDGNAGTGLAPTVVPAEFLNMLMMELVNAVTGSGLALSKSSFTQLQQAIQRYAQSTQVVGQLGGSPSLKAYAATASASITFTDEQIIVGAALNSLRYGLATFSQTINVSATGAGGMDAGAAPANGFVAIYAIYNPTTGTRSVLGQAVSGAPPSALYSGANMPAGYTASALIGILPTDSNSLFKAGTTLRGRTVAVLALSVLTGGGGSTAPTLTAIGLASVVPFGARKLRGTVTVTASQPGTGGSIAADANGSGAVQFGTPVANGGGMILPFSMTMAEERRIYYQCASQTTNFAVTIAEYEF